MSVAYSFLGASVKAQLTCNSNHCTTWDASKIVGTGKWAMPRINLLLISYVLMTGLKFDTIKVGASL